MQAQETIGGGTIENPAVGPGPSFGIGGTGAVLVKNWNFGTNGTIRNITDMNGEFFYHDQFNTFNNGGNYGANTVAPDAANAISGQPIEGVDCGPVRAFFSDSLQTYLRPLNGATIVDPAQHNAGSGSFMAKWELPYGGSWLGYDIVWETRVRYVTPPYFWFAIWTAGNRWDRGAEHDVMESFGYDNGGGNTNYDGRYWHSDAVPWTYNAVDYSQSWSSAMASVGVTNWDPTVYHTWTMLYKADNTYEFYMDGIKVQWGVKAYPWTFGTAPTNTAIDMNFLFDGGWGHTQVSSVNKSMNASNFDGKFYEWDYSRVYLVPPPVAPTAPSGVIAIPDVSTQAIVRWDLMPYASSYNVYRGTTSGGQNPTPIATGLKSVIFTDTGLTDGTTYYYKVAGVNSVGTSSLSVEVSVTPVETYTVDDANATYVGTWTSSTSTPGYYGSGYRHDGNTGSTGGKSARFTPTLPTSRNYDVYIRYPGASNRATNVPVDVNHASGTTTVTVDQKINSNIWVLLGNFYFNSGTAGNATIRNDGANGYVMADVLRWIPADPPPPPAPTDLRAYPGDGQAALYWTASTGATSYNVYRGTTSGGQSSTPIATGITATKYTDTTVTNGTRYYYKVAAVNSAGTSAFSNEASATPNPTATVVLNPIGDAYVRDGSHGNTNYGAATVLEVKGWSENSGYNRQSYFKFDLSGISGDFSSAQLNVYGKLSTADTLSMSAYAVADTTWLEGFITWNNRPAMSSTALATQSVTNTTAQTIGWDVTPHIGGTWGFDSSLGLKSPATSNGALFTSNSWESGINPPQLVVKVVSTAPPAAPTGLTASAGNAQVSLNWTASSGATSYNVKRATVSSGPYTTIATGVTVTSYINTGLTNGTTYYYVVSAVNTNGESASSNQASATPSGSFDIIKDNTDSTGITITGSWTAATATAGYYGSNYLHDGNTGKGSKSVRYTPDLPSAGSVTIYARWTSHANRATNVPIDVNHANGTTTVTVNQQQSGGAWVSLGTYAFNAGTTGNVLIRTTGTTGYVIADAVRFVKP